MTGAKSPPFFPFVAVRRLCRLLGFLLLALILGPIAPACSRKKEPSQSAVVAWPELDELEAALTECSELIESGKTTEVLLRRRRLLEVGWAVNLKTLLPDAGNVETLRKLFGDLSSKVNRLATVEVNLTMMREVIADMEPIVAKIGRVSGARRH